MNISLSFCDQKHTQFWSELTSLFSDRNPPPQSQEEKKSRKYIWTLSVVYFKIETERTLSYNNMITWTFKLNPPADKILKYCFIMIWRYDWNILDALRNLVHL